MGRVARTAGLSNARSTEHLTFMDGLYQRGSASQLQALIELREQLRRLGFYAEAPRPTEGTLRVYLERRHSLPLLNPRFVPPAVAPTRASYDGILEIAVLSKGLPGIATRLLSFRGNASCRFDHRPAAMGGYRQHGVFVIRITVAAGVPSVPSAALSSIRRCLLAPRRPV